MYFDTVAAYWSAYEARELDRTIHPEDDMYRKAAKEADYWAVGHAGLSLIASALSLSRLRSVRRLLDFGCGHGRVARHLRAFLPNAELFFCDIDETGARFCAETFRGQVVKATRQHADLDLPSTLDVIWLGSVFTHLPYADMLVLFDKLYGSLVPGGALIITYRGRRMHELMLGQHSSQVAKWTPLLTAYEQTGIAYQAYDEAKDPDWGLSLNSMESMIQLGLRHPDARLLCLSEAGWAVSHDALVWTRRLPD